MQVKIVQPKREAKPGDVFKRTAYGEVKLYMVAMVAMRRYLLISLNDANRYLDGDFSLAEIHAEVSGAEWEFVGTLEVRL